MAVQLFLGKKIQPTPGLHSDFGNPLNQCMAKTKNIYIYILILRAQVLHHGVLETFSIRKFKDFNSLLLKKEYTIYI